MSFHPSTDDPAANGYPLLGGYWTWDIRNDRVMGNAGMMDYFGHSIEHAAEGLTSAECTRSIDVKDRDRVASAVRLAIEERLPFREAYRVHTLSRGTRRILAQGRCYFNGKGEPSTFPGWFVDVTGVNGSDVTSLLHCRQLTEQARNAAIGTGHDFLCYLLEIAMREADSRLEFRGHGSTLTH